MSLISKANAVKPKSSKKKKKEIKDLENSLKFAREKCRKLVQIIPNYIDIMQ